MKTKHELARPRDGQGSLECHKDYCTSWPGLPPPSGNSFKTPRNKFS